MATDTLTRSELDAFRDKADRFIAELDEEYYLHYAGLKESLDLEPIYERHADLTTLDTAIRLQRAPTELWRFACEGFLGNLTRSHQARQSQNGQAPAVWKSVMTLAANHASKAAPLQGLTEISVGVLLLVGLFTRPVALVAFAFLTSLWVSEWGTSWIWELLVPVLASLALAIGGAGRTWGVDYFLARRKPSSLLW